MVRLARIWVVTLGACTASRATSRMTPPAAPISAAKLPVEALFEPGRVWVYSWETADDGGELTCEVGEIVPWEGGRAARLECDGNLADIAWAPDFDPIGGVWANVGGDLWRLERLPENGHPRYEHFLEASESTQGSVRTETDGLVWCRIEEELDGAWYYRLCVDETGIVDGVLRVDGVETRFRRKR